MQLNTLNKEEWKYIPLDRLNAPNTSMSVNSHDINNYKDEVNFPQQINCDQKCTTINIDSDADTQYKAQIYITQSTDLNINVEASNNGHLQLLILNGSAQPNQINIAINLEQQAHLRISLCQSNTLDAINISQINITQADNSNLELFEFTLGSSIAKNKINAELNGENINCNLTGLYLAKDNQSLHQQITVNHNAPNSISNQFYKGILKDKAVTEFSGCINVKQAAQNTNAYQTNKNLLLSDTALAHTRPQLQIDADNVKCSHGASTGKFEDSQIIYFQSRGINAEQAKQLLLESYANEIIFQLQSTKLKKYLLDTLLKYLDRTEV